MIGEDGHEQAIARLAVAPRSAAVRSTRPRTPLPRRTAAPPAAPGAGTAGRTGAWGSYRCTQAKNGSPWRSIHACAAATTASPRRSDSSTLPPCCAALDRVVVDVEPPREAEAAIQHVGADERGGRVAACLQERGQGLPILGEHVGAVVVHAVVRRLEAAQDRRVGRQRQRDRRQRLLEHRALRGEGVDVRRQARGPAVGADPVRAQRVDGDEEDARPRAGPPARAASSRAAATSGRDGDERDDQGAAFIGAWPAGPPRARG